MSAADEILEVFTEEYIDTLVWVEVTDLATGESVPDAEVEMLTEDARDEIAESCRDFLNADIGGRSCADLIQTIDYYDEHRVSLAGHDFALTRNGHGAGFWDRGLGQAGLDLTELAKSFGTQSLMMLIDPEGRRTLEVTS